MELESFELKKVELEHKIMKQEFQSLFFIF